MGLGCATTAPLPVASAIVVHACAAAEANAYLARGASAGPIDKTTIELQASGKLTPDIKAVSYEFSAGAEKDSQKTVTIELDQLPTLQRCLELGYIPQLGEGGCLWKRAPGTPCPMFPIKGNPPAEPPLRPMPKPGS